MATARSAANNLLLYIPTSKYYTTFTYINKINIYYFIHR